jgi:heat shock protein HtpX
MARPQAFGRDTGLQARMVLTMGLLTLVYLVFVGVLFAAGASAIIIVVVAVGLLSFQFFASDQIALRAMGAHEVTPQQAPQLHGIIDRLCVQADIPKPKVAIMDSGMANAFAMGRTPKASTICATTGILSLLEPAELEGVLAHEVTHIVNRDVAIMTLASFFASVAAMIVQFGFLFGGGYGGGGYGGGSNNNSEGEDIMIVILVSAVVWAVSFFLMRMLSRYREFAADRGSAVITGRPSALAAALVKIDGSMNRVPTKDLRTAEGMNAFFIVPARVKGSVYALFATHPPLEARLEALSRLESQLQGTRAAA